MSLDFSFELPEIEREDVEYVNYLKDSPYFTEFLLVQRLAKEKNEKLSARKFCSILEAKKTKEYVQVLLNKVSQ